MSEVVPGKLNRLLRELPEGLLVDAAWLNARGYSPQLCRKYVTNGWLERLAHGVYRKPGGQLRWEQVVISLQTLLQKKLMVGGMTALVLHGNAHFVRREFSDVHLYGPEEAPTWLKKLPLAVTFVHHNSEALFRDEPIHSGCADLGWNLKGSNRVSNESLHGTSFRVLPWGQWDWPLTVSTPERAFIELLDALPARESFDHVDKIMAGLATLSPRRLQKLLVNCKSVKVKRLFFFFADRHNHAWRKHLDKEAIDFGIGKRMLVPGGRLDPTYLITVPEALYADQ